MKVTVTHAHFKAAMKQSIGFCPVALALKDAGIPNVIVNRWGRRWYVGIKKRAYVLPPEAKAVAVAFDYNRAVKLPVTFMFSRQLIPNLNTSE